MINFPYKNNHFFFNSISLSLFTFMYQLRILKVNAEDSPWPQFSFPLWKSASKITHIQLHRSLVIVTFLGEPEEKSAVSEP